MVYARDDPANGRLRCLRCGFEFNEGIVTGEFPVAFCTQCVPGPVDWQTCNAIVSTRAASVSISRVGELEAGGQADELDGATSIVVPNNQEITPKYGEHFVVRAPVGEEAGIRLGPARVRFNIRMGPDGAKWSIKVNLDLNNWSSTRDQLEDRLVWADRVQDEYLEVLTIAGTSEIVWTSGWTRLSEHRHGQPRVKSTSIPDIALPLMRKRGPATFAPGYLEA